MSRTSQYDIIGKVFTTSNCGDLEVLGVSHQDKNGRRKFDVRFLSTGCETVARCYDIRNGIIRDPYYPSIVGVGYLGGATQKGNEVYYRKWSDMLRRCYAEECGRYSDYGGRGILVCDRWHSFECYLEDVQQLSGHDDENKTTIDRIDNDLGYSPQNCRWASVAEQNNNQRRRKDQKLFKAVHPDTDEIYYGRSQSEFARKHGLNRRCVNMCLSGVRQTHKNWKFEFVEEVDDG